MGSARGETQSVLYTNQQPQMPASLLWFHDHGLGATRLSVFAGRAAAGILRDEFETCGQSNPVRMPGAACQIPLAEQERQLNPHRPLLHPTRTMPPNTS